MTARTRMQLRTLGVFVLVACLVTPVFNVVTTREWASILQGILDAGIISLAIAGYLLFVREGLLRSWLRRWNFTINFFINSFVLVALFLLGRGLGQLVASGGDPGSFATAFTDSHLPYASVFFVLFTFTLVFVWQMNRMIGPNVLRYFVTGAYHRPREEDRAFLFMDLQGSTELAEQLGPAKYYALLRRFIDDLSEPILASRGQIYQYAGDEVVVTWPAGVAVEDGNCVRCYFRVLDEIGKRAAEYDRDFGTCPRFRAGLHAGTVIAGELGDLKREIVYVGDTLNVAARLEEHAKGGDLGLLVSDELLARVELPDGLRTESLGKLELRGLEQSVAASHVLR